MPVKTAYSPGEPIWTDVGCPDVDTGIAFYGALFGWECDRSRSEEFGGYSNFTLDGRKVAGVMPLMAPGMPPVWTSYVCTADADATVAAVTGAGGSVLAPPMDVQELGRMTVLTDAGGAVFGTWQPGTHLGAEVVGDEGTVAWIELSTRDKAGALPFYAEVFGWTAATADDYTELQQAGTSVAGCMDMPESVPAEVPSCWMPYFAAADPKAKAEQAVALGGSLRVPETTFPGGRFTIVADPGGAVFGLLSMPD